MYLPPLLTFGGEGGVTLTMIFERRKKGERPTHVSLAMEVLEADAGMTDGPSGDEGGDTGEKTVTYESHPPRTSTCVG